MINVLTTTLATLTPLLVALLVGEHRRTRTQLRALEERAR